MSAMIKLTGLLAFAVWAERHAYGCARAELSK